jgi:hypothetical protein
MSRTDPVQNIPEADGRLDPDMSVNTFEIASDIGQRTGRLYISGMC